MGHKAAGLSSWETALHVFEIGQGRVADRGLGMRCGQPRGRRERMGDAKEPGEREGEARGICLWLGREVGRMGGRREVSPPKD